MHGSRAYEARRDASERDPEPRREEEAPDVMHALQRAAGNAAVARWLSGGRRLARMTRFGTADPTQVSTLTAAEVAVLEEELQQNPGLIMSSVEQRRLTEHKATLPPAVPAAPGAAATPPGGPTDALADVLKGMGLDATAVAEVEGRFSGAPAAAAVGIVARLGVHIGGTEIRQLLAAAPVAELVAVADLGRRGLLDAIGTGIASAGWAVADAAAVLASAVKLPGKEVGVARLLRLGADRGAAITAAAVKKCLDALVAKPAEPAQVAAVAASFLEAGHKQPASLVNTEDPPQHVLAEFDVPAGAVGNPSDCRFRIVIPEGKIQHIQQGHTYEHFFFQSGPGGNNARNKLGSSLFHPGTDVKARAATAAGTTPKPEMWNAIRVTAYTEDLAQWKSDFAAWQAAAPPMTAKGTVGKKPPAPPKPANPFGAAPPSTTLTDPNYIVAFTHEDTLPASGTDPETYVFNVSQLVPGAGWMSEQMLPAVADGVGFLFGHP